VRRGVASLVALGAVAALCWIGAEWIVARLGLLEYPPAMNRGHPTRGYTLRAGFAGESSFGIPFRVSAQGFRSPEVAVPKPAGVRRVLVLGDSVAWGAGVREEETFPRRLEAALRAELDCPVEIVNASVSGYGSTEQLDVLRNDGLAFEPDLVLVYHVENDNQSVAHRDGALARFVKDHVVYRSQLIGATLLAWRTARWRAGAAQAGGERAAYYADLRAWDRRPGTQASLDALRAIAAEARAHGARLLLASHPTVPAELSLDAARNARLRALAAELAAPFVDVGPAFGAAARERSLVVSATDRHPNGVGHAVIAEALRPVLHGALDCAPRAGAHG
jgi:lysophospholipase L1-like esterase